MKQKATRRSPRGERSRATILQAASEEFAAKGYRGASLATIAERAGITQSGLLHHYPTKERLLAAVMAERFQADADLLDDAYGPPTPRPLAGYRHLAERNTQNATWVRLYTLLAAEGLTEEHPAHEAIRDRYEQVRSRLRARIDRQIEAGVLRADLDRDALTSLIIGAMDGLQLQWLYQPRIDMAGSMDLLTSLLGAAPGAGEPGAGDDRTAGGSQDAKLTV